MANTVVSELPLTPFLEMAVDHVSCLRQSMHRALYILVCKQKVGRPASELMSPGVTVIMVVMTARGDTHNYREIREISRDQSQ